jgi:hypothetical protein
MEIAAALSPGGGFSRHGPSPAPAPRAPPPSDALEDPEATFHPVTCKRSAVLAARRNSLQPGVPASERLYAEAVQLGNRKKVRAATV